MRRFLINRKRELIAGAVALAVSSAVALAQFAGAVLLNPIIQGHFINGGSTNPLLFPTASGCTVAPGSSDTDGACTASAASGVITFAQPYATAPTCVLTDASATSTVSMPVYTINTTQLTLSTVISGHLLFWHCAGKVGG